MSRSAWLLSKGTVKSSIKANTSRLWATKRSSRFLGGLCLTRPRFLGALRRKQAEDWLQPFRNQLVVACGKLGPLFLMELALHRPGRIDYHLNLHSNLAISEAQPC